MNSILQQSFYLENLQKTYMVLEGKLQLLSRGTHFSSFCSAAVNRSLSKEWSPSAKRAMNLDWAGRQWVVQGAEPLEVLVPMMTVGSLGNKMENRNQRKGQTITISNQKNPSNSFWSTASTFGTWLESSSTTEPGDINPSAQLRPKMGDASTVTTTVVCLMPPKKLLLWYYRQRTGKTWHHDFLLQCCPGKFSAFIWG